MSSSTHDQRGAAWMWVFTLLIFGTWLSTMSSHEWLCDGQIAAIFGGEGLRRWIVRWLGGRLTLSNGVWNAAVPFENLLLVQFCWTAIWWLAGARVLAGRQRVAWRFALRQWGLFGAGWWILAGSWTCWHLLATVIGWQSAAIVLSALPEMWLSCSVAGWMATFACLLVRDRPTHGFETPAGTPRVPPTVWLAVAAYTLVFGLMNSLLYANLLIPHGDSAMYEEHLWNLLHGKGFRSFIDKGLFLGEHIQVIHLGLLPVYVLWPSHVLLEWCESFGLALGAIPIYRMAWRSTGSRGTGCCLALAYLLFVPMQRLDISIDFKTFRPEAFGIPLLLASFDALDGRKWKSFAGWLLAALLVKEDYALIIGPLGVWLACHEARRVWWQAHAAQPAPPSESITAGPGRWWLSRYWPAIWPGLALSLGAVLYLWWSVKIAIPYFKAGHEVHYAKYFSQFGQTTNEIVWNLWRHPDWLFREIGTAENFLFGAALCVGLAGIPLFSPGRLAVGAPLFAALCLNQIARNAQHHFHAPLVAIVFWATVHGVSHFQYVGDWLRRISPRTFRPLFAGRGFGTRFVSAMVLGTAFGIHLWHSFSPGGLPFWDVQSRAHWKQKYVPDERAYQFAKVLRMIPVDRHVASTDFVHPRFNHHARSYDYSSYRPVVPADVEFLVIDVRGPYSEPDKRLPTDVPEFRDHPERWELLPDETDGYFHIFRRRSKRSLR